MQTPCLDREFVGGQNLLKHNLEDLRWKGGDARIWDVLFPSGGQPLWSIDSSTKKELRLLVVVLFGMKRVRLVTSEVPRYG